jgi:putative transposon-encoded protein
MMDMSNGESVAEKPMEIRMLGFEVVEKVAKPCATSARILVPKHWVGKRVRAVRLDP